MLKKLFSMFGPSEDPERTEGLRRMMLDHVDASKRFVFGILSISHDVDPAYLPSLAREALLDWYGIETSQALVNDLQRRLWQRPQNPAYFHFCSVFLARTGQAVGFVSEADSWWYARSFAQLIQAAYPSWQAFAEAYVDGHLRYRRSQADSDELIARYQSNITRRIVAQSNSIWVKTAYFTPLAHGPEQPVETRRWESQAGWT